MPSFENRDAERAAPSPGAPMSVRQLLERRLRSEGLTAALSMLNERTRFRFTGLYRVDPPQLCNVSLYDRENPALNGSGAIRPLSDTLCSIVYASGSSFRVDDATADATLHGHPACESVRSYTGVPVRQADGRVIGTLCHFDGRPRITPPGELQVLEAVAPLMLPWLRSQSPE